jgi:hypothetical protein
MGGSSKKEYKEFKEPEIQERLLAPRFLLVLLELLVLLVLLLSCPFLSESLAAVGERNFS